MVPRKIRFLFFSFLFSLITFRQVVLASLYTSWRLAMRRHTQFLRPRRSVTRTPLPIRRGNILVLSAMLMVILVGMVAFAVDTGFMFSMQTELQRSVDAAALAAAGGLVEGEAGASEKMAEYLLRNPIGTNGVTLDEDQFDEQIADFLLEHEEDLEVKFGNWNSESGQLEPALENPSGVRVSMRYNDLPLFFAPVFHYEKFQVEASATAMYQPRDMVVVLDLSASMNDDSELPAIASLGQTAVETNIEEMWDDLGNVVYGNLPFTPGYVTIPGKKIPVSVTWRGSSVEITGTDTIQQVKLYFTRNGSKRYTESFYPNSMGGSFSGNRFSGWTVCQVRLKMKGKTERFDFYNNETIARGLGLHEISYPYASGDWGQFIEFCRESSSAHTSYYDYHVKAAGYRHKFGTLLLIDFWNRFKTQALQHDSLWMCRQQPLTAVKESVDVFVDYVATANTEDYIGLSVYNSASGNGTLESPLTDDFELIKHIAHHRQAGHYHSWTNIGGGMQKAREELQDNARAGTFKMIVLMTDGNANWVNGGVDTEAADQYVRDEAQLCATAGYPIVTISLGANADSFLMDEVAEITGGAHFSIPGGQSVSDYSADLLEVFQTIAATRPLKIVH